MSFIAVYAFQMRLQRAEQLALDFVLFFQAIWRNSAAEIMR